MTSAMTAFGMALGGTSLICYLLMTRLQNRRANRGSSGRSPAPDGGNYADNKRHFDLPQSSFLDSF